MFLFILNVLTYFFSFWYLEIFTNEWFFFFFVWKLNTISIFNIFHYVVFVLADTAVECPTMYHFKLLIPCVAAGAIIGKGGETIAQLQREKHAKIKMSKANDFYPGIIFLKRKRFFKPHFFHSHTSTTVMNNHFHMMYPSTQHKHRTTRMKNNKSNFGS